jgi:uncharacterized membrane protein
MNSSRTSNTLSLALIAGSFAITGALYAKLPDRVPTHFNLHGVADGWMSRGVGAWLLPVSALLAWGLARIVGPHVAGVADARMDSSPIAAVITLVVALLVALQCVVLHAALASPPTVRIPLGVILASFSVVVGLFLPRVRRNAWVGVRTPWTLASDENWARTHRVAGITLCLSGVLGLLAMMVGASELAIGFVVVGALAPVAYSYAIARRLPPSP